MSGHAILPHDCHLYPGYIHTVCIYCTQNTIFRSHPAIRRQIGTNAVSFQRDRACILCIVSIFFSHNIVNYPACIRFLFLIPFYGLILIFHRIYRQLQRLIRRFCHHIDYYCRIRYIDLIIRKNLLQRFIINLTFSVCIKINDLHMTGAFSIGQYQRIIRYLLQNTFHIRLLCIFRILFCSCCLQKIGSRHIFLIRTGISPGHHRILQCISQAILQTAERNGIPIILSVLDSGNTDQGDPFTGSLRTVYLSGSIQLQAAHFIRSGISQ